MKKKFMKALALASALTLTMSGNAMAGEWKQDAKGWWWQFEDGDYLKSRSAFLDSNRDGLAELYYFGEDGYLLTSTTASDGSKVNAEGKSLNSDGTVFQITVATTFPNDQAGSIEGYYLGDVGTSDWNRDGITDEEYTIYYGFAIKVINDNTISVLSDQFDNMTPTAYYKVGEGIYELACEEGVDRIVFEGSRLVSTCSNIGGQDTFKK